MEHGTHRYEEFNNTCNDDDDDDDDDDDGYSKNTVEASLKWTPLVFEKGVRNWNCPLTGMQNYRVCMRVEKKKKSFVKDTTSRAFH